MTTRTRVATVTFNNSFAFPDAPTKYAPGPYRVETEEESIDGLSFMAYRRVATRIHLSRPGSIDVLTIDPNVLNQMLARDSGQGGDEYAHRDPIGIGRDS